MSGEVARSVPTVSDIGSRLAAFSIAVTVPSSGRTTYSFSLEWDKKRSEMAYTPKYLSSSPDDPDQNTVKDTISTQTFPTSNETMEEEDHAAKLLRQAVGSAENEKGKQKIKKNEKSTPKRKKGKRKEVKSKRNSKRTKKLCDRYQHQKSESFRSSNYRMRTSEDDQRNDHNEHLRAADAVFQNRATSSRRRWLRSRPTVASQTSIANLEDCNRLVTVKLYLRHFRPDGEIQEKVFSGEIINISTILDMLKFLLRNAKLPLMEHTFGRLFLLRDEFRSGRVDEMAYNTYRFMTLEEIEPQTDEHVFMLDLTDTFFDKPLSYCEQKWNV